MTHLYFWPSHIPEKNPPFLQHHHQIQQPDPSYVQGQPALHTSPLHLHAAQKSQEVTTAGNLTLNSENKTPSRFFVRMHTRFGRTHCTQMHTLHGTLIRYTIWVYLVGEVDVPTQILWYMLYVLRFRLDQSPGHTKRMRYLCN